MKTKKWALFLPLWPLLFMFTALAIFGRSPGFGVHKISSNFPYQAEWEVKESQTVTFDTLFSYPFTYLGNGAQCYAFESADHQYVLKFFKMKTLTPSLTGKVFPFGKFKEKNVRHKQRLFDTCAACKYAMEELQEETGLIYVHLNRTQHLKKNALLIDRQGKRYTVSLDDTVFLVQKKAEMVYKRIGHQIKAGDEEGATRSIQAVIDLVARRNAKGFSDTDTGISRNYGFVGNQPIHIDFLRLVKERDDTEIEKIQTKISAWIHKHYPQEHSIF